MSTSPEDNGQNAREPGDAVGESDTPVPPPGAGSESGATEAGAAEAGATGTGAQDAPPEQAAPEEAGPGQEGPADVSGAFVAGTPVVAGQEGRTGGVFSAETFALIGLLLLGATLVNTRVFELYSFVTTAGEQIAAQPGAETQIAQYSSQVVVDGATAMLAVIFAAAGLLLSNAYSRAWSRWAGAATIVVGILFVLFTVLTYTQVPAAAPLPPMMPPG